MEYLKIEDLKPHPRNDEFFDDMTGEKWKEFLESVKSRGIIEPIVITQNKVIVSGHQRVRACKELGIDKVPCDVHIYNNDDEILQDLLETNIRQRGDVGGSAKKVGKRIKELERIYGIKQGGSGFYGNSHVSNVESTNNSETLKTQEQLATQMGISVDTLRNYKMLADMIPELSDLVDTGIVTKTTALAIMKELSEEEQLELIDSLDTTKKITKREIQDYINKNKELETEKEKSDSIISALNSQLDDLDSQVLSLTRELEERPTVQVKVIPKDYNDLKIKAENSDKYKRQSEAYKQDFHNEQLKSADSMKKVLELQNEIQELKKKMDDVQFGDIGGKTADRALPASVYFCAGVMNFIRDYGGYVWITDYIDELPERERNNYVKAIEQIFAWAQIMLNNIDEKEKKYDELPE